MISNLLTLHDSFINESIFIANKRLSKVVCNYSFIYVTKDLIQYHNQTIFQKIKESNTVIIDHYIETDSNPTCQFFIIGFKQTTLIVKDSAISFLHSLFSSNLRLTICFLSNTKDIFDQNIKIQYKEVEISPSFEYEIQSFNQFLKLKSTKDFHYLKIWKIIKSCISGYLIKNSYSKLNYDRLDDFYSNQNNSNKNEIIKKDEFIELRAISSGTYCQIILIYHIEKEELMAIKKIFSFDNDAPIMLEREKNNYLKISHPFLPKFYGTIENTNILVFEYIEGKTLLKIKNLHLSRKEKMTIIFQLLSVMKYLHDNNFVYRDLKPGNIMIYQNKNLVLIDFDRMLKEDNKEEHTKDLVGDFIAPEIFLGILTKKSDIYSIGKIMYFIFSEDENFIIDDSFIMEEGQNIDDSFIMEEGPNIDDSFLMEEGSYIDDFIDYVNKDDEEINDDKIAEFICGKNEQNKWPNSKFDCIETSALKEIICMYTKENPNERPCIEDLIMDLCLFVNDADIFLDHIHPDDQYQLGLIALNEQNIEISIQYFKLASSKKHIEASYILGLLYCKGQNIKHDIDKSVYYLMLASNQNHVSAQQCLGLIYFDQDINKAIHYFSLAAKQNDIISLYHLGYIYYSGKHIQNDINKAIYYFSLAADQNDVKSQYYLGLIYYNDLYIPHNINKAIYYFSLASDQNCQLSQYYLGEIYYFGKFVNKDIEKSIYYLTLSSNKNEVKALFLLGVIYIERDINKSIHYFTLASNQNEWRAQYNLGIIYSTSEYIKRDINKAIHYFTLASNQNIPEAQIHLGLIYYPNNYYSFEDIQKSIYYFTLASNQNNEIAQFYLGIIYLYDDNIQRDINKSIHYLTLASEKDIAEAKFQLGLIYYNGIDIPRDINKSIYYLKLASDQNIAAAQYLLGLTYFQGKYIPCDIEKSIHYLSLSSKQNCIDSQYLLGIIYYTGQCIPRDIYKSIYYFTLASNQNDSSAQFCLGYIYFENNYIPEDIDKSIHYLSLASNQSDSNALFYLGLIYYIGKGVTQDIDKSIYYLNLASIQKNYNAQYLLGLIYYDNTYIERDINKSIYYLSMASIQNHKMAQLLLGNIYFDG